MILWPGLLFVLGAAGTIDRSVYAVSWLFLAEISGVLVAVSLALILVGIWRRESTMGFRTSQLFVVLSGFAVFAWVIVALFGVVVEVRAGWDCLVYYPDPPNCTLSQATSYGNSYVVPSLAVSFVALVSGLWNVISLDEYNR